MVYLKVDELLKESQKSRYWLVKSMDGNYRTINNMLEKETIAIRFDTIDKLCDIFNCSPGDLFERQILPKK